jgi:hypothetical protein
MNRESFLECAMLRQRYSAELRHDDLSINGRAPELRGGTIARKAIEGNGEFTGVRPSKSPHAVNYTTRGLFEKCITDLSQLSMHFSADTRLTLTRRLKNLLSDEHWDDSDILPAETAFLTLLRCMLLLNIKRIPSLGTNGKGSLSATWLDGKNRITLECGAKDEVAYVLSKTVAEGKPERAAGHTKVVRLPKVLEAYDPKKWFDNGSKEA